MVRGRVFYLGYESSNWICGWARSREQNASRPGRYQHVPIRRPDSRHDADGVGGSAVRATAGRVPKPTVRIVESRVMESGCGAEPTARPRPETVATTTSRFPVPKSKHRTTTFRHPTSRESGDRVDTIVRGRCWY